MWEVGPPRFGRRAFGSGIANNPHPGPPRGEGENYFSRTKPKRWLPRSRLTVATGHELLADGFPITTYYVLRTANASPLGGGGCAATDLIRGPCWVPRRSLVADSKPLANCKLKAGHLGPALPTTPTPTLPEGREKMTAAQRHIGSALRSSKLPRGGGGCAAAGGGLFVGVPEVACRVWDVGGRSASIWKTTFRLRHRQQSPHPSPPPGREHCLAAA